MATTFTWKIANLERETSDGFVFTAHWTVAAESDQLNPEGVAYSAGGYGSVGFERPATLIPYADLTETEVIGWAKEALGGASKVADIEAQLQTNIDNQITPPTEAGVPWQ